MNNFYFCKKRCTTTINLYFILMVLQSLQFILFCVRKMILYQIVFRILRKSVSFDVVVHFIDEVNMVNYVDFDCGIKFFPENPTKFRQINWEQNYISRSCEKPQCIPSIDQHMCAVDGQHSSIIFLNPYNLSDLVPAARISLSDTNDIYSMFKQYPQPTTQQPRADSKSVFSYSVFSSLQTMNSKRKALRVSFAFCQTNYLPDGWMNETVAKVEGLSVLWKPGAMDGTLLFVMNCSCI